MTENQRNRETRLPGPLAVLLRDLHRAAARNGPAWAQMIDEQAAAPWDGSAL